MNHFVCDGIHWANENYWGVEDARPLKHFGIICCGRPYSPAAGGLFATARGLTKKLASGRLHGHGRARLINVGR